MGTNNEEKRDKGQFVQFPLHLIYERKDLSRDDKWVLLSIMGTYWTEGPHRLSYREVAALSGVPLALLTSYLDKKTGKQHEGILDRLARTGDIRITQNKDTNPLTGQPRGQTQSYIWVNYTRLWEQNAAYCETRKSVPNTNASVPYTNTSVSDTNASVPNTNRSVPYTNDSVSVLPSETPPYITNIDSDITDRKDKEESEGEQTNIAASAPSLPLDALTPPQSENDTHSQQGDTHGLLLPSGDTDLHSPLECNTAPGIAQDTPGDPHGVASTQQQEIARTCDTCGRPQTEGDCPWCMTTRLPAIPKQTPSLPSAVEPGRSGGPTPVAPVVGGQGEPTTYHIPHVSDMQEDDEQVSHEQNRDASPGNVTVERDLGVASSVPIPPALPEVSPPRTMRATVVSPPPQVLVVSQQFSSVEDWKQAQESFVEQLRGIWKTTSPDFKRQAGNWNVYRKQYLDRWLKANPDPTNVQFTADGKTLFDEWCSLFKARVDAGKATIEAANWLAERLTPWVDVLNLERPDVLRDFKGWCYTNDKKGYYTRGVKLFDLRREFEGWQSYQQSLLDKAEREQARPQNKYGTVSGLPRLEIDPEWLKAMGGR